jgi:transcriptional repressor of cell division inhibition gene dicB
MSRMLKKDVIQHYGNAYKVAKALRVHQSAVSRWGERVPILRAAQLDQLTGGQLKYDLNSYTGQNETDNRG